MVPLVRLLVSFTFLLAAAGLHAQDAPAASLDRAPAARERTAELRAFVARELPSLIAFYHELHQHPELSFREEETAKRLAAALQEAGAAVTTGVGGHGLVGLIENGEGPTLMLRTDLDALPITEQTGLPFASRARAEADGQDCGVMHACGHDLHMTNLLGVTRYLAQHKDRWHGTVMCIGQPAEERGGGALAMLKAGLFTRWKKPDLALALHVLPSLPTGTIGWRAGPSLANVDSVDIVVHGKGGHGAEPETTIDPIVEAAELVLALQTIVSREIAPIEPAVITVGSIHGGQKHNIISDRCELQLTVRSYAEHVREHLKEAIVRKAKAVAAGFGAPEPEVRFSEGVPALVNDAALTARVVASLRGALGSEHVVEVEPVMGAEDFSYYGKAGVPVCMFRLGTTSAARMQELAAKGLKPPPVHSAFYYPDAEASLEAGIVAMASAALDLLAR